MPLDVLKTKMMNAKDEYRGNAFKATIQCASDTFRTEGVPGFFKGWLASYYRAGPHTILVLMMYDFLKSRI